MAETSANISLSGLARRLVSDGHLEEEQARTAIAAARKERVSLVAYLVNNKLAQPRQIAASAAEEFGDPLIDLTAMSPDSLPKGLVDNNLLIKHHAVPLFKRGNRLFVAVSDPTNLQAFEEECGLDTDAGADTSPIIVAVSIGKTAGSKGYAGNGRLVGVAFIDTTVLRLSERTLALTMTMTLDLALDP